MENIDNVIHFIPKYQLEPQINLRAFIEHCKTQLSVYEDQGGFSVDSWDIQKGNVQRRLNFDRYVGKTRNKGPLMEEPFRDFAKSYMRYRQSFCETVSATNALQLIRLVYEALLETEYKPCVLQIDGRVIDRTTELIKELYSEGRAYHMGGYLEQLLDFLRDSNINPRVPMWKNVFSRAQAKSKRTDDEAIKWQETRCPSLHQMVTVADIFAKAEEPVDLYWSSVLVLLMFAPNRAGELSDLSINSLFEDDGRLWVRWYGEKGFGHTVKPVPRELEETVKLAFERLINIGEPARLAAKFAYDNPDVFMRHDDCITDDGFSEDTPLNAYEFSRAFSIGHQSLDRILRIEDKTTNTAWKFINGSSKWIKALRQSGDPSYRDCAKYTNDLYQKRTWPKVSEHGVYVWETLLLIRDREFHEDFEARKFSWKLPNVNDLNMRLGSSKYPGKRKVSLFQRFNVKDEDGSEIQITSHQFRVWMSTVCERAGMDSWMLAKFSGRTRIQDNEHYDLRTEGEKITQALTVLNLESRPKALEALKMNLPVAFEDLGEDRIGVAQVTQYGFCLHDYAMAPCTKNGDCMTCKEHACVKGMPDTIDRIVLLEEQMSSQLEKAHLAQSKSTFGSDRWVTYLGWRLSHIRTVRKLMESDNVDEGAVIRIPPEHDPSPIKRALEQANNAKGYSESKGSDEQLQVGDMITGLLEGM